MYDINTQLLNDNYKENKNIQCLTIIKKTYY